MNISPDLRDEGDLNAPLLILTRDFLAENRHRHNQRIWFSSNIVFTGRAHPGIRGAELAEWVAQSESALSHQATGCFGAWSAIFAGWRQCPGSPSHVYDPSLIDPPNITIREAARRSLGTTVSQTTALFNPYNNWYDIVDMIDRLILDPLTTLEMIYNYINFRESQLGS